MAATSQRLGCHSGRHIGLHDNGYVNNVCLCDTVDQVNILIKKAIRPCFFLGIIGGHAICTNIISLQYWKCYVI